MDLDASSAVGQQQHLPIKPLPLRVHLHVADARGRHGCIVTLDFLASDQLYGNLTFRKAQLAHSHARLMCQDSSSSRRLTECGACQIARS